jgi:hypothetical protein
MKQPIQSQLKFILSGLLCLSLQGCVTDRQIGAVTSDVLNNGHQFNIKYVEDILVEDEVVAFGKSAQPVESLPKDSIVIAGKKYSYVLTEGGSEFFNLISSLNPKYIHIDRQLKFLSNRNDGHFFGTFNFSYQPPTGQLNEIEKVLFSKYGAKPCECNNNAHSSTVPSKHKFEIELSGVTYPVANNVSSLKPLSKPYKVSIYRIKEEREKVKSSTAEKIVLLPFAVAIDVITLPAKVLGIVYQP